VYITMILQYLRSFRVFNISIFDYVGTYVTAFTMFNYFGITHSLVNYMYVELSGHVFHILFNQQTTLIKLLLLPGLNYYKIYYFFAILYMMYNLI
jgi:hypothetical protein